MKIAILLTAVALASGSALAAQNSSYDSRDTATTHQAPVVNKDQAAPAADAKPAEGIVERTKSAIRRMGERLGRATDRWTHNGKRTDQAADDPSRSDTRAMGAAGSGDNPRQRRMDDAYGNWRGKQK